MKIKTQIYDLLTTIIGFVVSSGILLTVDWGKLMAGDNVEKGKIVGAILFAVNGWLTNKTNEMKIETIPTDDLEIVTIKNKTAEVAPNAPVDKETS